jgi:hypothetical protein
VIIYPFDYPLIGKTADFFSFPIVSCSCKDSVKNTFSEKKEDFSLRKPTACLARELEGIQSTSRKK